jgi:phage terminase large subunit
MADIKVPLTSLIAPPFYSVHHDLKAGLHSDYWLKGGRGSTKSSFTSVEIILGMIADPQANAVAYRKVAATLHKSVFSQILKAIKWLGVRPYFRVKLSPLEITYIPTGQRILFSGADDPNKSKSITLTDGYFKFLWVEEPTEFDDLDEIRTIQASIIRGGGPAFTLLSYNPPIHAANWINTEVMKPVPGRLVHHSSYLDVPRAWLGDSFISGAEAVRDSDERAYKHMYLGEVTGTGGAVFENVVTRPVTDAEIKTFGATYAGLDFGWYPDPLHFVRCAYFPAQKRLVIYDEYRAQKQSNYDAFRHLVDAKGLTPAEEVIADSAEQKSVADMRSYGVQCVGATKGPGTVDMRIKWLQGLKEIVIDSVRCPHAAKEFLEYEYERARDGSIIAAYPDKNNHAIDAVGYATNRIWLTRGA